MGQNESNSAYKQVASATEGDPTKNEDLMFVFHTTDEDSSDRVVHDNKMDYEMWPYYVTCNGRLLAERKYYCEPVDNLEFFRQVQPGDAVEFVKAGKRFHWAIYVGHDMFVHLHKGKVCEVKSSEICTDRQARPANIIYKQKSLPAVQIVNNAQTQVGKTSIWSSSECFAMWCRTGKAEFTNEETQIHNLDSKSPKISQGKYVLEMQLDAETATKRFHTLSELVEFRRNVEKFGKEIFIIEHL
ncbi:protein LRATD2-like [Clavelina lepadiformis]|uniref:LRAT domain-containing protein n=1 Tax=Clavelina lepadiformis TaxID=159417 RepID=A0ABP0H4Z2_CLALP